MNKNICLNDLIVELINIRERERERYMNLLFDIHTAVRNFFININIKLVIIILVSNTHIDKINFSAM